MFSFGKVTYFRVLQDIGKLFLMRFQDEDDWVVAESLFAIFEVFDDFHQDVFDSLNMMDALQQMAGYLPGRVRDIRILYTSWVSYLFVQIKEKVSQNADPAVVERLDETLMNVNGFMDYKRQQKTA